MYWSRPATIQAAYEVAASIDSFHEIYESGKRSIHQIGSMESRTCYACGRKGHLAKDCRSKDRKGFKPNRGNRGRGGKRGRINLPVALAITINGMTTSALVDSGNTIQSAMSENFFYKLRFTRQDLKPSEVGLIGTADSKSPKLKVLGEPKQPLQLCPVQPRFAYDFMPPVVRNLAMSVNISGSFMQTNSWDQLHSEQCSKVKRQRVPLCHQNRVEPFMADLYVEQQCVVPPRC